MDHDRHDLELVAAFAVGDIDAGERARASALVASCEACAALAVDIAAIACATRGDARLATVAPRDHRLSPADARRLRGTSPLARLVRALGFAGSSALRPAGTVLATFGIAAFLLAGGLPGGSFGAGGAATGDSRQVLATADTKDLATQEAALAPQATGAATPAPGGLAATTPGPSTFAAAPAPASGGSRGTLALLSAGVAIFGVALVLLSFRRRPRAG